MHGMIPTKSKNSRHKKQVLDIASLDFESENPKCKNWDLMASKIANGSMKCSAELRDSCAQNAKHAFFKTCPHCWG